MTDLPIVNRLRNGDTRRCPFGKGMPRCDLRPEDPCPICGMTGEDLDQPDKCVESAQGPLHLEAADAIEALYVALEKATHELNAIRARDGAPQHIVWDRGRPMQTDGCTHEYWNELTEECYAALRKVRP